MRHDISTLFVSSINIKRCADVANVGVASHRHILSYVARRLRESYKREDAEVGFLYKSIFVLFMFNNGINRDSNYETFNLSPFSASVILCLESPLAGANWKISNYVSALWYTVMNLYCRHYTVVVLANGDLTWQNPSRCMYEALLAPIKSTLASSATQIECYLLTLSSKRAKQYLTRN